LQIDGSLDLPTVQVTLEQDPHFPKGYAVYLNQQLYLRYTDLVRDLIKVAFIIAALALVVIIFGTFNAASLTMAERKQDIAILQTIGFRSRAIRLFLLGRTLLQTLVAFFLAWGVVAIIAIYSLKFPIVFFAKTAVLHLSPKTILLGLLLTMLSASLGVWLTTHAQSSQNLADQLRE
jgi:lipoprotein-releasing system permease protein